MTGGYTAGLISDQPPLTYDYVKVVGSPANYTLATGQGVIEVNEGDVIDIVLQNGVTLVNASDPHPWHLHGMVRALTSCLRSLTWHHIVNGPNPCGIRKKDRSEGDFGV